MEKHTRGKVKGITLMALVITVIVLLILSGITIATLSGKNGIINQSLNAKDSAAVKSEMRIVEVASNSARGKNKNGIIEELKLKNELATSAGKDKTSVERCFNGAYFLITFLDSNRVYKVDNEDDFKYLGATTDELMSGVLNANPRRDKIPKKNRPIEISIRTIRDIEDDDRIEIRYGWVKSRTEKPETLEELDDLHFMEENHKIKYDSVKTDNLTDGKWYLYVEANVNDGELISDYFGDYIVGDNIEEDDDIFMIAYVLNGGTNNESNPSSYTSESEDITLLDATRTGYTFTGWTGNGTTTPTKNLVLPKGSSGQKQFTANWEANTYTIAFNKNSESATGEMADLEMTYGVEKNLTQNTFTRTGYEFGGWNTKADGTGTNYSDGQKVKNLATSGEITLYAKWNQNARPSKPIITANYSEGNAEYTSGNWANKLVYTTITSNSTENSITAIQYSKDNKATWNNLALGRSGGIKNTGSSYYGQENWTATNGRNDTIYFRVIDSAGNISDESDAFNIKYDTAAPVIIANNITYGETLSIRLQDSLSGVVAWQVSSSSSEPSTGWTTITSTTDKTVTKSGLTAGKHYIWAKDEAGSVTSKEITVTYLVTYEKGTNVTSIGKTSEATTGTVTLPTITASNGYTVQGWYNGNTKVGNAEGQYTVTGNVTLTAKATASTYTIAYAGMDEATHGTNNPTSGTYDAIVQISNPTKNGYTFAGWTSSSSDGLGTNAKTGTASNPPTAWTGTATKNIYFKNLTDTNNGTVTLTATWTANTYTITLNKASGTGGTSTIYETYGTKYSLTSGGSAMTTSANPVTVPTRSGYEFQGYYTGSNGSGTQYISKTGYLTSSASNTFFTANGTLYAYWKRPVYEITLDNQGATTAGTTKIYLTYSTKYSLTADGDAMSTSANPITIPTKAGYAFKGYYDTSATTGGTQYINQEGYKTSSASLTGFTANGTLYARWEEITLKKSETSSITAKFLGTTIERRKIKSITFANSIAGHTVDGTTCFDVSSVANARQVLLWITNTDENGYVDIVIGQNGGVKANPDSSYLFSYVGYDTPLTINFTNFNTLGVTDMTSMFSCCGYTAMTSLNLGNSFDTSNVTNMSGMFSYCGYTAMTSLNLGSSFNASNVINMNSMFYYCGYTAMASLDLGDKFNTSSVTSMSSMFECCGYRAMTSLSLGNKFDTSSVNNMRSMFRSCGYRAMTSLSLGDKFDTSSVTNMSYMFYNCGYIAMTSLDLEDKFDTSSVTNNMVSMFEGCGYMSMTNLDLGDKFDTSSVLNMDNMFCNCGYTAMTSLDLGDKFNTSSVTTMYQMFFSCGYTAMTSLDLGDKFDTSSVTYMRSMFHSCGYMSMTSLDLGDKFDTSNVTTMQKMFSNCGYTAMTSLDLGEKFDTSNVQDMSNMFNCCGYTAMTSLDLGDKFNASSATDTSYMFTRCGYTSMTSLDIGDKFDTSSVTNMQNMFQYCGYTAMTSLDLSNRLFDTSNVTNMLKMFQYCGYKAMTSLDLGDKFDTSNVTNMSAMFAYCGYTAMTSLDLGDKFDTSNATSMMQMFQYCGYAALTSLDLGDKFDTSSVTNMQEMFYYCPNLVTIYATDSFVTTSVTNGTSMFNGDTKLVGGMGTVYDNNHRDHAYAHVDLGTTNPGYFTDKRTYYVEFDANCGTGTMARQVMTYGVSSNLTTNAFTKAGCTFAGWNTKADGSGTSYTDGQSVLNLENGWKKVKTLYAQWSTSTYTVEYYQGNNSTTAGSTKFSITSSHTYGTAKALTTYATLGGTAPSGWTFAGWSTSQTGKAVSTVNSVSLTDGASVTNLTSEANGTVKLYAIFKRSIVFKSGSNAGTTNATKEQRYNPYKTTGYLTSVTSPSALTSITGWTKTGTGTGYRNDETAGAATIGLSASVTPAYNATALTYYGVYTKAINVYSGVSKGTNNSQTQYLNTNGNKVSSISLAVPTAIENWTAIGYRGDTTADDKEIAVTTSAVSVTPEYSTSAINYYAVYSRTLTISYNGNSPTSGSTASTTKTVYLNTNSTTTSSQQVTLANNGFIKNGYMFSKWAVGNTDGTQYAQGASYTTGLAYNASSFEVTMYAIWQDVYLRTSENSTNGTTAKFLYTTIERRKIKSITFANSIAGHTVDGETCFDVSSITNSGQVLLWITNTDGDGYSDIVIGQNGGVKANPNSSYLFGYVGYDTPFAINFTNFDTSSAVNMSYMFDHCGYTAMTTLNLGNNFDTSNVTSMSGMFNNCGYTGMTSLNLGDKFDTSNVTKMYGMFSACGCTAMTSLDLGDKFDTSNVVYMSEMFAGCGYTAMTSLDLGDKFDTSSVTDMDKMFSGCGYKSMTSLDLGDNFDTSSVETMESMFNNCGYTAMTSLNLGDNFNTSSVTTMATMFKNCGYTAMTSLNLGDKFDTSSVTTMRGMFEGCGYTAMIGLDLGDKFDTSSVTAMNSMFNNCGYIAMTSLDLGDKFDTSSVTTMYFMFTGCGYTAMTSLDLGDKFDTSNVKEMNYMFEDCGYTAMTSLDLGDKFDTSKVTDMYYMFYECGYTAMTSLDLGDKFDTSSVTNMQEMFYNCPNLVTIYATDSFVTTSVTSGSNMFTGDTNLVGGMGTTYDSNHTDHAYAHLDLGTTNPGYFTDKRTYYVEFDANGGTGTMARQIMTYGESSNLTTNAFTKTGYTFAGWNTEADGSGTSYTNGQSVLNLENGWNKVKTLYAQWTVNTYTISYDYANGIAGTNAPTSGTYDTDVEISNPTRNDGYSFAGWTSSTSDGLGENATTGLEANPSTAWTGTATKNTYFKNLTDTNNGTVKLTATWKANYKLKKVIGASNLISNGGFDNYTLVDAPAKAANGVTHTWDKELNGVPGNTSKAYKMTYWDEYANGTGANMNVYVPEIGYHAHMRIVNGNNVIRFKTNEAYAGQTAANVSGGVSVTPGTIDANRWLGVSQQLTGTNLTAGATYVVTLDAYRVSGNQKITGGLYYATNSNTERAFNSGQYAFRPTKTGEWETFSWTFTLDSNYQSTINPSLYVYGCLDGTGEIYVDNIRLEKVTDTSYITKAYDSLYTTEELTPATRTGYAFDGWYSDARFTKRIDETDTFNTNTAVFEDVNTPETSAYIYAKWRNNSYNIVFNKNNSSASGAMTPMAVTCGDTINLTNNNFAVTTTGVTSKQIFTGWNTAADGSGTSYTNGASVSFTATPGQTVTLYAQWIDANYEVSSPVKYTLDINDAISKANASATIKVLKTQTDNTAANIAKNLTLNLNGKTLTRNASINITAGNFTINGSADGQTTGTLYYNNTADSSAVLNTGASSSVTIQYKTDLKSKARGIKFGTAVANGNLNIYNSYVHSEGAYSAIQIDKAKAVDIYESYIFSPYGYPATILVNVLPTITIRGKSRVGGGNLQDSSSASARGIIVFSSASQSTTTKLTLKGNAILMAGWYCKQAILANRTINVDILEEAEVYSNNGSSIILWTGGSTININTSGWVYAKGSYVVSAGANSATVYMTRGTLVAPTQYMLYVGGTTKWKSLTGTANHEFYVMNTYYSYKSEIYSNLYEYGNGFVKVGNSSSYRWTFISNGARKVDWVSTNGGWYYFWNTNNTQQLGSGDTTTYISGYMVTKWIKINGNWFYLDSDGNKDPVTSNNGKMHTGHLYINNKHYFLAPYTGFKSYDSASQSVTYTFEKGQMVTGYVPKDSTYGGPYWYDPADGVSR